MKSLLSVTLTSIIFFFSGCQQDSVPAMGTGIINQQFELALQQSLVLKGSTRQEENSQLGEITFSQLEESRCPANVICVRQGAAVTTFKITAPGTETQTVRLFVGDFMANDPRKRRSRTADTATVQLASQGSYRLILKQVAPYPGTREDTPKATLLLERE